MERNSSVCPEDRCCPNINVWRCYWSIEFPLSSEGFPHILIIIIRIVFCNIVLVHVYFAGGNLLFHPLRYIFFTKDSPVKVNNKLMEWQNHDAPAAAFCFFCPIWKSCPALTVAALLCINAAAQCQRLWISHDIIVLKGLCILCKCLCN